MSTATEALASMPLLRKRLNESSLLYSVWRRQADGHIGYLAHQGKLHQEVFPGFEILAEFSDRLEALEFIVFTMLEENKIS